MKEVIHFNTQEERMAYLKGGFEEITPKKVTKTAKNEDLSAENEKKYQNKASKSTKSKKTTKKGAKKDEISAE